MKDSVPFRKWFNSKGLIPFLKGECGANLFQNDLGPSNF
jgi:hypothetical protein